ncbi:MAG: radical SAM/SPASM domain-containing protein [Magnetococcales bacterium]|nr:radical SAM/SPASM domain-containing protein [Magnetococcales bacterium]
MSERIMATDWDNASGFVSLESLEQVEIQIVSWCNRECSFCPSGTFPTPKVRMSLETVDRIITELEKIGFSRTIGLHLMCEPLLHNKLPEIIRMFRSRLPRTFIRLESNGDPLNKMERLGHLFDCGLNEILINCYDSAEQWMIRSQKIAALRPDGGAIWFWNQCQRFPVTEKHEWRVVRLRAFYEGGFSLKNWAGLVPSASSDSLQFPLQLSCNRPGSRLHVNYRGEVLVCNMDWKFEVIAGDFHRMGIAELLNAPILRQYRTRLAVKDRDMPLCRACDSGAETGAQPGYPPVDRWVGIRARWLDWERSWMAQSIKKRLRGMMGHR